MAQSIVRISKRPSKDKASMRKTDCFSVSDVGWRDAGTRWGKRGSRWRISLPRLDEAVPHDDMARSFFLLMQGVDAFLLGRRTSNGICGARLQASAGEKLTTSVRGRQPASGKGVARTCF